MRSIKRFKNRHLNQMDPIDRVKTQTREAWEKNRDGMILFASGGLLVGACLPAPVSAVVGAIGIVYVATKPPPDSSWFMRLTR